MLEELRSQTILILVLASQLFYSYDYFAASVALIENAESLGLTGDETFTIHGVGEIKPRQDVEVQVTRADGSTASFTARCRIDTYNELEYFKSGGILHYVLRRLAAA